MFPSILSHSPLPRWGSVILIEGRMSTGRSKPSSAGIALIARQRRWPCGWAGTV